MFARKAKKTDKIGKTFTHLGFKDKIEKRSGIPKEYLTTTEGYLGSMPHPTKRGILATDLKGKDWILKYNEKTDKYKKTPVKKHQRKTKNGKTTVKDHTRTIKKIRSESKQLEADTFKALKISITDDVIYKLSEDYITNLTTFNHLFESTIEILEYLKPNYII